MANQLWPGRVLHAVGKTTVDSKVGQRACSEKRLAPSDRSCLLRLKSVKRLRQGRRASPTPRAKGTSGRANSKYAVKPNEAGRDSAPFGLAWLGGITLGDSSYQRASSKYSVHISYTTYLQ